MLRKPGQLSISARECCSSFQHPLQEAVYPCLVCGWKARTSSCLVKNLPKVMSLFLSKPFLPCNLSLCVCFAPVWKQSMDSDNPAWALSLHLPSPAVALVLCAFVTSLQQQISDNARSCSFYSFLPCFRGSIVLSSSLLQWPCVSHSELLWFARRAPAVKPAVKLWLLALPEWAGL